MLGDFRKDIGYYTSLGNVITKGRSDTICIRPRTPLMIDLTYTTLPSHIHISESVTSITNPIQSMQKSSQIATSGTRQSRPLVSPGFQERLPYLSWLGIQEGLGQRRAGLKIKPPILAQAANPGPRSLQIVFRGGCIHLPVAR